ncbi:P-loop containing nucleoside triphosphate hydrolase protein [Rhizodiscina lignyota]|uniref:P-loop containing nucleoside triphosphate hydrolase protein n=1 Tax=Rhizodiscina lignyota TaxID=1504668 RepID=A0A9P4M705_9PEZI|nr:P-loop containing nucleoside triphosphate hydrolase protein [Rhizodiscina lignyota]
MPQSSTLDRGRLEFLDRFFTLVLHGKRTVSDPRNAKLYIEAICSQTDPLICTERLNASSAALSALHKSVTYDLSPKFLNSSVAELLGFLSSPSLRSVCNGQFLRRILSCIVDPPTLWNALLQAQTERKLERHAIQRLAWLVWQLLCFGDCGPDSLEDTAQTLTKQEVFISSPDDETKDLGRKIKEILSITSTPTAKNDDGYRPGGRHDNDFEDFRKIAILPTPDELASTEKSFYRRMIDVADVEPDRRIATHLDNQFRLLREDMLKELRDGIQNALGNAKRRRRPIVFDGLSLVGIDCGTDARRKLCGLALQLQNDLPQLTRRKAFLKANPDLFRHESFGCLMKDSEIVAFGQIDRNEDQLARIPPIITLQIASESAFERALLRCKAKGGLKFMQVDTPMFAYQPILECLQSKTEMSLTEELFSDTAGGESSVKPHALLDRIKHRDGDDLKATLATDKSIILDKSQLDSLVHGLTRSLSLIQGPPGTGKSFIGALIAKALINHTSETLLVLCYTNHAVDQYMEDLMDIGIPSDIMVRLGNPKKCSARTESLLLFPQSGNFNNFSAATWKAVKKLKEEVRGLEGEIKNLVHAYESASPRYADIMQLLEFSEDDSDFFDAFTNPVEVDGMEIVGSGGRSVAASYLFDRWKDGRDAGVFEAQAMDSHAEIWTMSAAERHTLHEKWISELLRQRVEAIGLLVKKYNVSERQLRNVFREKTRSALKQKRIIGCTTTFAAKYTQDIQAASPGVLIVEEAGEILESHVLTALSANTKQVVLIGDHKQLRPKVNNYALMVQQGDGFNLNQSLFERLVLSGVPHTTLQKQHRMCPEISSLVRNLTYPDLADAPGTANRPPLRGFQNRLVFVNHNQLEFEATQIAEKRDPSAKSSKQNVFEADMVLKCVKYLGQQGYGTDDIVILTPYLGQLYLLRTTLSETNDPVLNDLDTFDLVQAGLLPAASASGPKRRIKLSTIDNYQGEESDIVVVSLVRSNSKGEIGFMSEPERINVMLSRARNALIMLGNADTFMKSRKGKTWKLLMDQLKHDGSVYDGIPVKCERHPDRKAVLQKPEDFHSLCPDGGCLEPCGVDLNCGDHVCPHKCHQLHDHSSMECRRIINVVCTKGHKSSTNCFRKKKQCSKCEQEARDLARRVKRDHDLEMERERIQDRYALRLAEIQDEIEHEKKLMQKESDEIAHQQTIEQTKQELADLRAARIRAETAKAERDKSANSVQQSPASGESGTKYTTSSAQHSKLPSSSAREEWEHEKKLTGASNDALDALMKMIGLEDVKEQFLITKEKVDLVVRQGASLNDERFSAALLGNPGTGKTTVARLYGKFLCSVGVLPGNHFIETSGSKLANAGVSGCEKHLEEIKNRGGGVLFIDEAYQLVSGSSHGGKAVLDFLLAEIENLVGKVVFMFAGYEKQMEDFFAHNPGIPSRVPYQFRFQDYDDAQLLQILESRIHDKYKGGMEVEGGPGGLYLRIVARRIGTGRGREGFGNARAVHNTFSQIADRQARRIRKAKKSGTNSNVNLFTKEDLIGPEPSDVLKDNAAWKELQNLIGLKSVKDSIKALLSTLQTNYQMELEEKPYIETSLNRVFLGSPGTGKTSVAKLYGQVLADIGFLSNGEVIVKNPADFVGNVLGQSEANTKAILAATVGKVLVIDEAYMLYQSPRMGTNSGVDLFSGKVIDTIVAEVQSTPGEDRCVLLLGYKDQMEEMLQNVNPGLARRFPLSNSFYFEDFSEDELAQIFDLKLRQQGFSVSKDAHKVALEILSRARNQPHSGNGGEIDILLNRAKEAQQLRISTGALPYTNALEARDLDPEFDRADRAITNCRLLFKDVIGCDAIVAKLEGYQKTAANMRSLGEDPREGIPFNFLFRGPPGTGKTTTARKMGKVFFDMGFLSKAEVIECSATDLIGQYVGHTGPKVQKQLEGALGKVLFIDEAYRLGGDGFAKEAMDELVDGLTKVKYAQRLVVILAGYDKDINKLMATNPGLTSRFPEDITFTHLTPEHCLNLFTNLLSKRQKLDITCLVQLLSTDRGRVLEYFKTLSELPNWGNGRDVETLAKTVYRNVMQSVTISDTDPQLQLSMDLVFTVLNRMTEERRSRAKHSAGEDNSLANTLLQSAMPTQIPQPEVTSHTGAGTATKVDSNTEGPQASPGAENDAPGVETAPSRDEGVSDEVWQQLQQDILAAQERDKDYAQMMHKQEGLQKATAETEFEELKEISTKEEQDEDDEDRRRREQERLKREQARRRREAELEELINKRKATDEARRKEALAQKKLREMGVCCAGFRWIKQSSGYRCAGGSHSVSDSQLGM